MLKRFKAFVVKLESGGRPAESGRPIEEYQLAAAALLVEAAQMDDDFDEQERATILALLTSHFGLDDAEAQDLLSAAEAAVARSNQLYAFTRAVKDAFDSEERRKMVEMLWEVAYSDGEVHDYEASLIRRVTGLLHVSDRDAGAARKRVLERRERKD